MQAIEQAYERTLNNIPEDTCARFAYHYIPCHELNTICKKARAVTIFPRRYRCLMDPGLAGDWPTLWSCGIVDEAQPDVPNTEGRDPHPAPTLMEIPPTAVDKHSWRSLACSSSSQQCEFQLFSRFYLSVIVRKLFWHPQAVLRGRPPSGSYGSHKH